MVKGKVACLCKNVFRKNLPLQSGTLSEDNVEYYYVDNNGRQVPMREENEEILGIFDRSITQHEPEDNYEVPPEPPPRTFYPSVTQRDHPVHADQMSESSFSGCSRAFHSLGQQFESGLEQNFGSIIIESDGTPSEHSRSTVSEIFSPPATSASSRSSASSSASMSSTESFHCDGCHCQESERTDKRVTFNFDRFSETPQEIDEIESLNPETRISRHAASSRQSSRTSSNDSQSPRPRCSQKVSSCQGSNPGSLPLSRCQNPCTMEHKKALSHEYSKTDKSEHRRTKSEDIVLPNLTPCRKSPNKTPPPIKPPQNMLNRSCSCQACNEEISERPLPPQPRSPRRTPKTARKELSTVHGRSASAIGYEERNDMDKFHAARLLAARQTQTPDPAPRYRQTTPDDARHRTRTPDQESRHRHTPDDARHRHTPDDARHRAEECRYRAEECRGSQTPEPRRRTTSEFRQSSLWPELCSNNAVIPSVSCFMRRQQQQQQASQPTTYRHASNDFIMAATYKELIQQNPCWFWGRLSVEEAESLLTNQENGAFLVRDSNSCPHAFTLSFRCADVTHHTRVQLKHGKFMFCNESETAAAGHASHSLIQFIDSAVQHSVTYRFLYFIKPAADNDPTISSGDPISDDSPGNPVQLLQPFSRLLAPASLKYLSRLAVRRQTMRHQTPDRCLDAVKMCSNLRDFTKQCPFYDRSLVVSVITRTAAGNHKSNLH